MKSRTMGLLLITVAMFVSACGASSEPTATYDGTKCDYDGPTEFELGSTATFTFTNNSGTREVGFSVWTVPEGTTTDEILQNGIFEVVGPEETTPHDVYDFVLAPTAIGEPNEMTITLDTPGQHAVICFDVSSLGGPGMDHASLFRVSTD